MARDATDHPVPSGAGEARSPLVLAGLLVVLVAAVAYVVVVVTRPRPALVVVPSGLRPTGIPAAVSTSTASLMALSPVKTVPAPGFHLVDQHGVPTSLAGLRGKVVVLEFMDPHCTDICPIVSQEFVRASHDLGALGRRVVFMAINVNRYHASTGAMLAFSEEHGLETIPSWRFVTGPTSRLERAWAAYHIQVEAPNPNADIIHTSAVYFIDPSGRERYVAMPEVDHTTAGKAFLPADQLVQWGRGIAQVVRSLVPSP